MNPDEEMKQLRALQKTVEEIVLGNTAGPVNAPEAVRRALVSLMETVDSLKMRVEELQVIACDCDLSYAGKAKEPPHEHDEDCAVYEEADDD